MKLRLIKPGHRNRVRIIGNACENLLHLEAMAAGMGMERVGFVKYWLHVAFWWRKKQGKGPDQFGQGDPELN